jgi:hypothetical protein
MMSKANIYGDRSRKPVINRVDRAAIHDGLHSFDRWTCWRFEWKENREKWDKPPINARTLKYGDSTKREAWCSLDEALSAHRDGADGIGIGFVLGEDDCGVHFSGIDLDDCIDDSGELSEMAQEIVATMDSYTEISPSGTGVKIFCIGKLPVGRKTKNAARTVEIYSSGRYFTVTGRQVYGTPKRVEARQEQLEAVWAKYIGSEQVTPGPKPSTNGHHHTNGQSTDAALAAMLRIKPVDSENDGSNRLLAVCCRAIEHDLSDDVAIQVIRQYEQTHPFPAAWSDADILRRLRDAERKAERGTGKVRNTTDTGNGERFAEQHALTSGTATPGARH